MLNVCKKKVFMDVLYQRGISSAVVSLLLVSNTYKQNTNSLTHTPQPVAPALSGCLATVGVAWLLGPCGRGGGDAALISS